jgi:hypothetical protein
MEAIVAGVRDVGIAESDYEWIGKEIFIGCKLIPRVSTSNTTTKANIAYICKWKYKYFSVTQGTVDVSIGSTAPTVQPLAGSKPPSSVLKRGELDFTFASPPI